VHLRLLQQQETVGHTSSAADGDKHNAVTTLVIHCSSLYIADTDVLRLLGSVDQCNSWHVNDEDSMPLSRQRDGTAARQA
jgi:hypothetical protein